MRGSDLDRIAVILALVSAYMGLVRSGDFRWPLPIEVFILAFILWRSILWLWRKG
jgi:hypothetical protein